MGLPKLINAIGRKHWSFKQKESVLWRRLVHEQCLIAKITDLRLNSAALTLTRHSSRAPDSDGLVSSFKVVIDALVKCGVLKDDNFEVIGMPEYHWVKRPTKQGGMITVKIQKGDK